MPSSLLDMVIPTWVKPLAIVVGLLGLSGVSYYEGYKHEKVVVQSKIVDHVVTQTKYVTQVSAPAEAKIVTQIRTVHDKEYLEVLPSAAGCDLPAVDISVLNSLRGTLPTQP